MTPLARGSDQTRWTGLQRFLQESPKRLPRADRWRNWSEPKPAEQGESPQGGGHEMDTFTIKFTVFVELMIITLHYYKVAYEL